MFKWVNFIICLSVCFSIGITDVFAQLDNVHYLPPLHSRREPGPQYLYLSTPSIIPITIDLTTGTGSTLYDCNGIDISSIMISNAAPAILCIGLDYGTPLLVDLSLLNQPLKDHGIILKSNELFYSNLRIYTNNQAQAGSLTSKGQWSLGRHFRIGHIYSNNDPGGNKCHIIGVMATKDNTRIQLQEYAAGLSFAGTNPQTDFVLNKGECTVLSVYVDAINPINDNGLMGSLITADQPIVVSCGSWDGSPNNALRDMGIDQITPVKFVGDEYILIQGIGPASLETPIVIADKDNTAVFLNGNLNPDFILNAGEWKLLPTTTYSPQGNMYIQSSKDIVVYQMIGGANDPRTPGLNFIPTLSCLGDSIVDNIIDIDKIGSRVYAGGLMIVAHTGAWVNINDVPISVPAQSVSGNFDFVTYRVLNGLNGNIKVSSSDNIQVGMYGYASPSGFAGYFSGFENFNIELDILGSNCGDSIKADISNITYFEWYKNDSFLPDEQDEVLRVNAPGWYQLVGYQCEDERDSSQKIWIGRPDTVYLDSSLCNPPSGLIRIEHHINWTGCDSTTIINYVELPKDTTYLDTITCDLSMAGITRRKEINRYNCDSIIFIRTSWIPPDTTIIFDNSCFPQDTGIFYFIDSNHHGCDSVIQYEVELSRTDTTDIYHLVCDLKDVRIEKEVFENIEYCDSTVRQIYELTNSYFEYSFLETCMDDSIEVGNVSYADDIVFNDSLITINGCDSIIQYDLTFYPTYKFDYFDTICDGDSILFEGEYLSEIGDYSKEYSTQEGCDSILYMHLEVLSLPDIVFNEISPYCLGDKIEISTKNSFENYFWSTGSHDCCILTDTAGNFNVEVTDSNGCINNKSVEIPKPISIETNISYKEIYCFGDMNGQIFVDLIVGGDGPYSIFINGVEVNEMVLDSLDEGEYIVEIVDQNGCSSKDTIDIIAPQYPFEILLERDTLLRFGDQLNLNTKLIYGVIDEVDWYINGDKINNNELFYEFEPIEDTSIDVVGFDPNGCMAVSSIFIKLYIDPKIYIPNVFTPNNDGVNDFFTMFPNDHIIGIKLFEIYSRWGELMYKTKDQALNSKELLWNGTFLNEPLNNNVFVYNVIAVDIKGNLIYRSGSVTLVK